MDPGINKAIKYTLLIIMTLSFGIGYYQIFDLNRNIDNIQYIQHPSDVDLVDATLYRFDLPDGATDKVLFRTWKCFYYGYKPLFSDVPDNMEIPFVKCEHGHRFSAKDPEVYYSNIEPLSDQEKSIYIHEREKSGFFYNMILGGALILTVLALIRFWYLYENNREEFGKTIIGDWIIKIQEGKDGNKDK